MKQAEKPARLYHTYDEWAKAVDLAKYELGEGKAVAFDRKNRPIAKWDSTTNVGYIFTKHYHYE